jgi:hypothetical protein
MIRFESMDQPKLILKIPQTKIVYNNFVTILPPKHIINKFFHMNIHLSSPQKRIFDWILTTQPQNGKFDKF